MTTRPNVLLIVIDQFRADLLNGRLADVAGLRNLQALAQDSCSFHQHYTVVTPCGPSRVSLFTGQYAMNHRAVRNGTPLRHDTPNLSRSMRDNGYDPLLFGYTDTAQDPRVLAPDDPRLASYEELMPGFTEVLQMRQESGDQAWRDHLRARGYDVPDGNDLYIPAGDTIAAPARYSAQDSDTAFLTDRFLDHIGRAEQGWFAALTYIRPHPPFVAPAPFNAMFDPGQIPSAHRLEGNDIHPFIRAKRAATPISDVVEGFPELADLPENIQQIRALYLGLAAEVDHHIGRILNWLKESGRWDDTILVVTADHGEMLGDFGLWGKGCYNDAAFHIPLMIRVPGIPPRQFGGMTESIDLAPTILDLTGGKIPDSMNGISLRSVLETGKGGKVATLSEHDFGDPVSPTLTQSQLGLHSSLSNLAVLRSGSRRLVHFAAGLPQVLFKMSEDGTEINLSSHPEANKISLDLSRQMLCHRMAHQESTFSRVMVTEDGVKYGNA